MKTLEHILCQVEMYRLVIMFGRACAFGVNFLLLLPENITKLYIDRPPAHLLEVLQGGDDLVTALTRKDPMPELPAEGDTVNKLLPNPFTPPSRRTRIYMHAVDSSHPPFQRAWLLT